MTWLVVQQNATLWKKKKWHDNEDIHQLKWKKKALSEHRNAFTLAGHFGKADLKSGKEVTPGQVSSFGVPKILHF